MKNEKASNIHYCARFMIMSALFLLSVLVGLVFLEYRFFCAETHKLLALKAQYRFCLRDIQKKHQEREGAAFGPSYVGNEHWGVRGDNFIMVNRNPEYLKNSMINYLKDSQLDSVLSRVNIHEWQDYTGQISIDNKIDKKVGPSIRKPVRASRQVKRYSHVKSKRPVHGISSSTALFSWPIDTGQFWLSSLFGPRKKANGTWGKHMGIDMAATKGTLVKAAASGKVLDSRYASGYGNMIVLHHSNRYKTRFAHLDKIFVQRGQEVLRGEVIGTVGATGFIRKKGKDGSHLHFEVYSYNKHINPLSVLPVLT